jgi:hypothetical protein
MLSAVTQIEIVALNYARCKRGLAEVRPTVGRPDPRRGPGAPGPRAAVRPRRRASASAARVSVCAWVGQIVTFFA